MWGGIGIGKGPIASKFCFEKNSFKYLRGVGEKGLMYCFEKNVLNTSQVFTLYNIISIKTVAKSYPCTHHASEYQESEKSHIWLCDPIGPFPHTPSHIMSLQESNVQLSMYKEREQKLSALNQALDLAPLCTKKICKLNIFMHIAIGEIGSKL